MKRYTLTVPDRDNDGRDLSDVHAKLEQDLTFAFGGCTVTRGHGTWQGGHDTYCEPVTIYAVDVDDTAARAAGMDPFDTIAHLAAVLKVQAGQEAVYLARQDIDTWLI